MQAIILAAGPGRRLGQKTPKPLLEIQGQPLLIRLIEQFQRCGIEDIIVVTGYRRHQLEEAVSYYGVKRVFNPFYLNSDNLVSFWMGRHHLSQDCILAHGDLIFEPVLLEKLLATPGDIVLPMDRRIPSETAIKIQLKDGKLVDLGKMVPIPAATGESIPLMKLSARALEELKTFTERILESGRFGLYVDDSVLELIQIGRFETTVLEVTGMRWAEIDTQEDFAAAKRLFPEEDQ